MWSTNDVIPCARRHNEPRAPSAVAARLAGRTRQCSRHQGHGVAASLLSVTTLHYLAAAAGGAASHAPGANVRHWLVAAKIARRPNARGTDVRSPTVRL